MKVKQGHWIWPYLLIAPALLTMLCVVFIPVVQVIVTGFQYYGLCYPSKTQFLGLGNYIEIFAQDPQFWSSIFRTLIQVVFGVGLQFLFGFILVLILNHKFFGYGVACVLSMVPWVTPGVLIGLMWRWLYDGNYGVINDVLIRLGILEYGISFLSRHEAAMPAAVVSAVWQGIPFFALMLLAALQGVPSDVYEAADIDGASDAQKLFCMTISSIKNTLFVAVLLRTTWVASPVNIIQNMTAGGPVYATQTLSIYVYQKAHVLNLGYASAVSVILAVLLLVVAVPYLRSTFQSERS